MGFRETFETERVQMWEDNDVTTGCPAGELHRKPLGTAEVQETDSFMIFRQLLRSNGRAIVTAPVIPKLKNAPYKAIMGNAFSTGDTSETAFYDGLPRVESSKHETSKDRRDRTLKHLLRANHHNYAVLYNNRKFHNHAPHVSFEAP